MVAERQGAERSLSFDVIDGFGRSSGRRGLANLWCCIYLSSSAHPYGSSSAERDARTS